jgi:hypothetical protein
LKAFGEERIMPMSEALNYRADYGTIDQSGFGILPTELYVHVYFVMEIRVRHGGSLREWKLDY